MKKVIIFLVLFFNCLYANTINIAVAANVSYAMDEIIETFNKQYPNTKVKATLGSSGKLTAQIKNGAPYDIFMSANMSFPNALYKDKKAITKPIVYAKGSLALLSKKQRSFIHNIDVLKSKLVKRIAIANPKTAPYGKATMEVFNNTKILNDIKSKLIYAESISATVSYTMMAADLGIIAKSSLYSKKMKKFKENIHWIEIDSSLYTPIEQGIVILKRAKENKGAKDFYDFVVSQSGKNILNQYGYIVK
jgi:molybdate transport system substrate-binding protein